MHALDHPVIDAFLDYLWEENHPLLVHVALGDEYPGWFAEFLEENGIPADEFRQLLASVAEIVFGSFYAAADDRGSLKDLNNVLNIVQEYGISPPPLKRFADSRFCDGHGWGLPLTRIVRDEWRAE
jgi:hypothetical protein